MAVKIPEPEETEMNMTPMIDIVFQLIIFFLLSLKFKAVDRRIDSALPKDRGIQATQQFVDELPMITVKLFRQNMEDPNTDNQWTTIKVGNSHRFELPKGVWAGEVIADRKRQDEYDKIFVDVEIAIRETWAKMDNNPEAKGEIKTPRPKGLKVPHGDVIRVLSTFNNVGLSDVKFEGAHTRSPPNQQILRSKHRSHRRPPY
jgi:hypothetical protein